MELDARSLDAICSLIVDCPHSTPTWTDSGYVVLRNQNIRNGRLDLSDPSFTDRAHFDGRNRRAAPVVGDIVITREAPMGEVCMIPDGLQCCIGQRQVLLRPNAKLVNPKFLLYALQSPTVKNQIGWNEGTGSTVSNVRIPVLKALSIPVPDRDRQNDVAEALGAIDDRIDLLRQTNATLEAIAQALFKSWFVDFDPVHAKAEGREPEALDAATAALFPSEFEESELGPVPKGWRATQLAELCSKVQNGGTPSRRNPEFWEDGEIPWFKTGELADGFLSGSSERITQLALERASAKLLPRHAILMAIYAAPTVGRLGVLSQPSAFNQACTAMIARVDVGPWFLFQTLKLGRDWYNNRANGAAQQNISKSIVESLPCIEPARGVLGAFSNAVGSIYERIELGSQSIATLATLRDTLLPRLISGKLRLPDATKAVEEAVA